jgi:putative exporter of polyketide antibiotics
LLIEFAGTIAIVLTFVGVVAAIRSSAAAAPVILAASVCGLSIGVVDALHDVTRSRLVATGFAIAAVAAAFSAVASVRMAQWERSTVAEAEQPLDARLFQAPAVAHHDSEIASPEVSQPSDQH